MSNLYFGEDVDQALVLFQLETELDEKHRIFVQDIKPAFEKLINYHYYRTSLNRNDDLIHDCMSFLYEVLEKEKFDSTKYSRGFPYFNMIVKHYFIQKLKAEKKKSTTDKNVKSLSDYKSNESFFDNVLFIDDLEDEYEQKEFIEIFKEVLPKWKEQFSKEQERLVIDALIILFDNSENIEIFNKKAIFWYLKDITGLNSKQVATNLAKIKKKFSFLKRKYQKGNI